MKLSDDRGLLLKAWRESFGSNGKAANLEQINFYTGARVRVQNLQASSSGRH